MNNNNMDELLINASLEERTPSVSPWNRESQKTNTNDWNRKEIKPNGGDIRESDLDEGKDNENVEERKDEKTRNISVKENLTVQSGGYEPSFMSAGARSRGLNSSIKISKALIEESKQVNLEEGEVNHVQMKESDRRHEEREINTNEQHIDTDVAKGTNEKQDHRWERADTVKPKRDLKQRKNVYAIGVYPNPLKQQMKRREYKGRQQNANTKEHTDMKIHPLTILRRQHETIDNADDVYDISPAKDRGTLSDAADEDEDRTRTYRRTHSKDRRRCESREKSDKGNKHTLVGIVTPEINQKPVRNSREITKKSKKQGAQFVIDGMPCKPIEQTTIGNNSDSMMRVPADHKNAREPRSSKSYTVTKHYKNTDTLNKNSILTQISAQQVNSSIGIGGINKTMPKEGPLRISVKPLETMSGDAPERHDNGEYHNNNTVSHVVVNGEIPGASSTADDMEILVDEVSKLPEESDNYLNHMFRRPDSAMSVDPKLPNAWVDERNQLQDIEIVCDLQSELGDTNENEPPHVSEESEKKLNVFQRLFNLVTCCFRSKTDH